MWRAFADVRPPLAEAAGLLLCWSFAAFTAPGDLLLPPIIVMTVLPVSATIRGVSRALRVRRQSGPAALAVLAITAVLVAVMFVIADHHAHWYLAWSSGDIVGGPSPPWREVHPGDCGWTPLWQHWLWPPVVIVGVLLVNARPGRREAS